MLKREEGRERKGKGKGKEMGLEKERERKEKPLCRLHEVPSSSNTYLMVPSRYHCLEGQEREDE